MIHIPDHLVSFYNINRERTDCMKTAETSPALQPNIQSIEQAERGPLSYVAGYVVSNYSRQVNVKVENTKRN